MNCGFHKNSKAVKSLPDGLFGDFNRWKNNKKNLFTYTTDNVIMLVKNC